MLKIHIVQKGDTLWTIAKKYGVSFEELKKINAQLSNPDMIMPGMKIKIPGTGESIKKSAGHKGMMLPSKEMKYEHPFKEMKPPTVPFTETPSPKIQKEFPKEKPQPVTPVMPQPIVPDVEINQHFELTMDQVNQNIKQEVKKETHKKPSNIFPGLEESVGEHDESSSSSSSSHHKMAYIEYGDFYEGGIPYVNPYYCYPSAFMPFFPCQPQWTQQIPVVQPPMPYPVYQQPAYAYGLPGVDHYEMMSESFEESSSAVLPFMDMQAPPMYPPGAYWNQPGNVPISPMVSGAGVAPNYGTPYPGAVYPSVHPQPIPYRQESSREETSSKDCHCQDQSGGQMHMPSYPGGWPNMPVPAAPPYQPMYPPAPNLYGTYGQPYSGPTAPYGEQGHQPPFDQSSAFRTPTADDESHEDQ